MLSTKIVAYFKIERILQFSVFFRNNGPDCPSRLLCQANKDIFGRGHVLPSVMTYISNLIMSLMVDNQDAKTSSLLLAAQKGRKGQVDCIQTYSKCNIEL